MFTGLVSDVGQITRVADSAAGRELRITTRFDALVDGESIAVNGACLTVREHGTDADGTWFTCAAVVTTLDVCGLERRASRQSRTGVARW